MNDYTWFAPSVFSIFVFGLANFLPKLSVDRLGALQAILYHGLGVGIFGVCVFAWHRFSVPVDPVGSFYGVLIGIMGMLGQLFYVRALQKGAVSIVSIIASLYPAVTVILAMFLLNEQLTERQTVGTILALVALVMLISGKERHKNKSTSQGIWGQWIVNAIAAMLMWAGWAFFPKIALQTLPPYSVLVHEIAGSLIVIIGVLFFVKFKVQKSADGLKFCTLSSILSACAIFSYIYALSHGPVSLISVLTAVYPVVTIILARIFLKERLQSVQIASVFLSLIAVSLLIAP